MKESILYEEGQKPGAIGSTKISEHAVTTDRLAAPPAVPNTGQQVSVPRSNGHYNKVALKRHALEVSKQTRKGKFTRVSEEFENLIVANIEAELIRLRREVQSFTGKVVEVEENFLTGEGKARVAAAFNQYIGHLIHRLTKDIKTGKTF